MRQSTQKNRPPAAGAPLFARRLLAVCTAGMLLFASCAPAAGSTVPSGPVTAAAPGASATPATVSVAPPAPASALPGNAVLQAMAASYSASNYIEGDIPAGDLQAILQGAARAPSAKNAQPWHFTVLSSPQTVQELYEQAAVGSVLVVISGRQDLVTDTVAFDCGLAGGYMQLAAESLGYGARILISPVGTLEARRQQYGIPDGYAVQVAVVIGRVEENDGLASATGRDPLEGMVNYVP